MEVEDGGEDGLALGGGERPAAGVKLRVILGVARGGDIAVLGGDFGVAVFVDGGFWWKKDGLKLEVLW